MKKSLLSIFLAGVLFFSNIGMTSFAVEREQDASGADVSSQEDGEKENEKALDISEEEEISYYKITDFTALPENISQQKVRIGASLDDIDFPDTLEVKVEPDLDREDRIMRKLAQERERIRKEKELEEAEAASSASSDEADEAASEGSSFDEEEIIIFDDGEYSDDASELSQEDERKEESTEKETGNDAPATDSTIAPSEPVSSTEESALPVETGEEITEEQDDEKEPGSEDENIGNEGDGAENSSDQGNSMEAPGAENTSENGLIGRILDAFRSVRVYAADDSKEDKEESKDDLDISENEKTEQTSEPSIERISGIEWVLEAEYNDGVDFFSPDQDGQIYLFTPVLLIPDNYYIEDELPIITVIVSDEYFPFDEAAEVDGVTIRVRADKGVFPEGATVSAQRLSLQDEEKVQEAFDEQVEVDPESIVKEYTFDITVLDRDGNEVQPDTDKGSVFVSFETEEVADESLSAEVYHFVESAEETTDEVEKVDLVENEGDDIWGDINEEDIEFDVEENELGGEREDVIFDDDVVLFVEKLETEVVEVDESQAIEVETFGFSTYKVLFKFTSSINAEIEYSPVSLEQLFDSQYSNSGQVTAVTIDRTYGTYLYADILNYSTNGGHHIANTNADGLYSEGSLTEVSYEYFLIVRRPFGKIFPEGIEIKVSYETSSGTTEYPVTIKDTSNVESAMDNYNYPTATELGAKAITLEMPMSTINGGAIYQWEKKGPADSEWTDIPLANTGKYHYANSTNFEYEGYWLRCTVNGVPSKEIQIVTPGGDSRTWTAPYGSSDQCYVSDGKIAYTICTTSGTAADPSKKIFDIVGEFQDGTTRKMMSTTNGGEGWRIFSNLSPSSSESLANVGWTGDSYNMDYMYFSFTEDHKLHVTAQSKLSSAYDNLAFGAQCKVGSASSNLAVAKADSSKCLTNMAIIGGTKEAAQKEVNNGTNGIASVVVTPSGNNFSTYFVGANNAIKPYHNPAGYNPTTEYTDSNIGIAFGWTALTGKAEFDIAVGGVSETNALVPVSKTGDSKSYSLNSNVKTLKLSSDAPLDSYAKSDQAGGVNDIVKIELRFNSGTSSGKTAISNVLLTYAKTTTTTSTTSNTSGSSNNSNSSTTPYSADYFDVNVKNYKNGSTSGITVDEINDKVVIEVNYNFENKENIKVYRDHNGASELKQDDSGAEGTCRIDKENGKIYIYTKKFSTYAVAYKPEVYYTVTFKDGTNTNSVKVKAGEKVARPTDPVKEGYTFVGWFKSTTLASSSTTSSSSSSKVSATDAFDFETPITANIVLNAGWTSTKDAKEKTGEDGDVNGARAPGTNDSLPIVWLWVLVLIAGVSSFGYAFYERFKAKGGETKAGARMSKLKRMILLVGIVVSTVVKFLIKKLKQHKYECMLAASAVLILISVVTLVSTCFEYRRSEEIYIDVNDEYVDENSEIADEMANAEDGTSSATNAEDTWWKDASVDVAGLSAEYPDVVGWIYFENEDISYPIMYSGDNSKYLGTAYTGQKAKAGAIFIDGESTPDFSDPHSLIYGHNMRDLSMFGRLKFYKTDASYYDEHQYFQVFTKDGVYRYQIFAYEEVPDSHDVFWVYGQEPEGMDTLLKEIEQGSYRKTGVNPTEGDHIITLATCTSKEDRRLIVSAVRTDEHNF